MKNIAERINYVLNLGVDPIDRTLYLFDEIGDESAYRFVVSLHLLDKTPGDITVYLNSGGGAETSGYVIYDAMRLCKNNIRVIGTGCIQSMAAVIFQGGDLRLLTPESRFMIHNGQLDMGGESVDADKLLSISNEVAFGHKRYASILAERSNQPLKWVKDACAKETYFSAQDCIDFGFADGIVVPTRGSGGVIVEKVIRRRRKKKQ